MNWYDEHLRQGNSSNHRWIKIVGYGIAGGTVVCICILICTPPIDSASSSSANKTSESSQSYSQPSQPYSQPRQDYGSTINYQSSSSYSRGYDAAKQHDRQQAYNVLRDAGMDDGEAARSVSVIEEMIERDKRIRNSR